MPFQRRRLLTWTAAAAAGGSALAAGWAVRRAQTQGQPEQPAASASEAAFWSQAFATPVGGELRLDSLRGGLLLVNFWATWCPPCIEELPLLDRFATAQASRGWRVVGLAIDQPSAVRSYLARAPVGFPVGLAGLGGTQLAKDLGNLAGGLPFTVVFAGNGTLLHRKMGQLKADELDRWATQLG